jgi:hypothetical protein
VAEIVAPGVGPRGLAEEGWIMAHHRRRARPPLGIARGFERSRLEDQLVAAAYELTVPLVRRPLSSQWHAERPEMPAGAEAQRKWPRSAGGITA